MSIRKRLQSLFSRSPRPAETSDYRTFTIRCGHCGTRFRVGYHPQTDLLREPEPDPDGPAAVLRKEAMDDRCFRKIRIEIGFDARHAILYRDIDGGEFVDDE